MEIQSNSRQVPKIKEIVAEKYYSDILYSHLQVISSRNEEGERFFPKSVANFSNLGDTLNLTRQTISKRFKKLEELGLITFDEEKKIYILTRLTPKEAFLVPHETLRKLVNGLSENSITIYVYLINRYIANNESRYQFSLTGLKDLCGLGTKTANNNYIITDILDILARLGLIEYEVITEREEGQFTTKYFLTYATATLPE